MRYVRNLKKIFFLLFAVNIHVCAVELIQGDAGEGATTTFTFPIQSYVMSLFSNLFVAAHPDGVDTINDYAVSYLPRTGTRFYPLTPEKVLLNKQEASNPLYNKTIQHLAVLKRTTGNSINSFNTEHPVVVTKDDLEKLYVFNGFYYPSQFDEENKTHESSISMISIEDIKDVNGDGQAKIAGLTASGNSIFAGAYPNAGAFGDLYSGISLLVYGDRIVVVDDKQTTEKAISQNNIAAVDKTSILVTLGADLTKLDFNDIYWDPNIGVLYVAFSATGANGARGVVAGTIQDQQLVLKKIAPDALFTGNDEIVGTATGNQVTIQKIRSMKTTNWLTYLIVLGGNSTVDSDKDVFALPTVNNVLDDSHGTLAKFDSEPEDMFLGDKATHSKFWGRYYGTAAAANADILKTSSEQARVGRGSAPGNVVDMRVYGDSVFIAVEVSYENGITKKQVYFSRALFDELGRIKSWTAWQTAKGAESKLFGFAFDVLTEKMVTLENDAPNNDADDHKGVKSVRRTEWGIGDETGLGDLVTVLQTELPQTDGGIHSLFDFSSSYDGVDSAVFMIATGRKKIVMIEAERADDINKGNFSANTVTSTDGSVPKTFNNDDDTRVVVISGGVLDELGAIEAAEIAHEAISDLSTRIFVGGTGGLAALVNTDNSGIDNNLKAGFKGLTDTMSFKKIGDYTFVRKLFCDSNFLYVLTDTKLDRITLEGNSFTTITLAEIGSGPWKVDATFLDVVASGKLCLLGTSDGLYRSGNGNDVTGAAPVDISWTKIEQSGVSGPAARIFAITKTGLAKDLEDGGNLEILNGYIGKNRAKLNRFYVSDYSSSAISENTVQAFPDGFVEKRTGGMSPSYYLGYGTFRSRLTSDGRFHFSSFDRDNETDPDVKFFGSVIRSGEQLASAAAVSVPLTLSGTSDTANLIRSSASGDFLVATSAGLFVNE